MRSAFMAEIENPFTTVIAPAQTAMHDHKIPASVTLAQWALESNFGKDEPPGSNNPFGIKAVAEEPSVECETHEVIHGITKIVWAKFAKYTSLAAAFEAHALIFYNGHYAKALEAVADPYAFADALTGTYATDPHYGLKLRGLMQKYNLTQYDKEG